MLMRNPKALVAAFSIVLCFVISGMFKAISLSKLPLTFSSEITDKISFSINIFICLYMVVRGTSLIFLQSSLVVVDSILESSCIMRIRIGFNMISLMFFIKLLLLVPLLIIIPFLVLVNRNFIFLLQDFLTSEFLGFYFTKNDNLTIFFKLALKLNYLEYR